ncbi:MAG: hypothetical protein V4671_32475 [Armatimonadota bacterium]
MTTRSAANSPSGKDRKSLKTVSYPAGFNAGKTGSIRTLTVPGADGVFLTANLDLINFLDPLSQPITACSEVYRDGAGI